VILTFCPTAVPEDIKALTHKATQIAAFDLLGRVHVTACTRLVRGSGDGGSSSIAFAFIRARLEA
jgi:hypothetical protein